MRTVPALILFVIPVFFSTGCCVLKSPTTPGSGAEVPGYEDASRLQSVVDLEALNQTWPGEPAVTRVEDAFRVTVRLGDRQHVADTHLFGDVRVVPYHDADEATDAAGHPVGRGDAVLSTHFPPGEIGIAVKHHRPEFRTLSFDQSGDEDMKEHFKLQDSHVGIVVGVRRDGAPGVITVNNPQSYEDGRLGEEHSPMLFLRPTYPWYLNRRRELQFRDNIRTMALGFNAVSDFPGDYNGGDPLGARNPDEVREHVRQMILAIGGSEEARDWFRRPENLVYCSELAHLSFSAGMIVPLNEAVAGALAGETGWNRFTAEVTAHNAGRPSAFTTLNENTHVRDVTLALADEALLPAARYAPLGNQDESLLAFRPMTMADILESFLATHLPRARFGESLAPLQGDVFRLLQPGLLEIMAMNELPASDPRRQAVQDLFDRIATVVSTEHGGYGEFRTALEPLLEEARTLSGPRGDSGTGLFVPPSLMHLVAMGRHKGGLMGLDYVGHGLHWSLLRADAAGTSRLALLRP